MCLPDSAHAFSGSARAAIEKAGGKAVYIGGEPEAKPEPAKKVKPPKAEVQEEPEEEPDEEPEEPAATEEPEPEAQ